MTDELAKTYDPSEVEEKWYKFWEENGYFQAEVEPEKEPFAVMMPPPNITGQLHLGHALDDTLQDIIVRWNRMKGLNTLWLPGTDHASIATEAKVVDKLRKSGVEKDELGREEFLKHAWDWKQEYGERITGQIRNLGASCDWSRERFTLDDGCSEAVKEVFVRLYEEGLIYQGDYIVNWCSDCATTLSDIEVEHEETDGHLYYIKYPFKDREGHITVATTRPETMLGDTGIAVDPSDERYTELVGEKVIVPLVNREIEIIADRYVDSEFGTGMVKVTPAHDPNDFEIGERNDLEQIKVIDFDGTMTETAGKKYAGLERGECRKRVVEDLEEAGLLIKVEDHHHSVGHCYRCDEVVEPMISKQWFVKMDPLAKPAIEAVKDGEIEFVPDRFSKVYLNWMENIKDWCISRQLWWGHRIPVWYCQDCGAINVSRDDLTACKECGSENIEQDEDVLDTWFSSALWPFSTLGWPEETEDLMHFYPTDVLVTGRDIIFFWVARMIFMGLHIMDEKPFDTVYVHGLIRDAQGRKMSKSLGNGIDPLEVIDEYGADALRFMLITGNTPGNDMRFRDERLNASRNFANKIWNAARFMLMHVEEDDGLDIEEYYDDLNLSENWILSRLNDTIKRVDENMEKYLFGEVSKHLYDFIWSEFCDWYLELIKPELYDDENPEGQRKAARIGQYLLSRILQLLHPIMPFITEEIWNKLPGTDGSIMLSDWPEVNESYHDQASLEQMDKVQQIIKEIRNIRNEFTVNPGKKITAIFETKDKNGILTDEAVSYIKDLASVESLEIKATVADKPAKAASAVVEDIDIILPLEGMIDIDKEIKRLEKEADEIRAEIKRSEGKLANEGFVNQAPEELVEAEREKLPQFEEKLEKVLKRIEELKI